jgi:DNA-binding NarL/FixJ family response regulator
MSDTMSTPGDGPRAYRWNVAVVEDHLLQRKRTEELVTLQPGLRLVWSGETLPEFQTWLDRADADQRPHLLLLDLMVERGPGATPEQIEAVIAAGLQVLVISALASPAQIKRALRAGVGGIVGKRDSEADIVTAIWTVLGGGHWMTPELAGLIANDAQRPALSEQEERVLVLYASGLKLDAVAEALAIKADTAKKYLNRVKVKYAAAGRPASTKLELHELARRDGLLDD